MFKGERTWTFWVGLVTVASASIVVFSTLWSAMFIYPLLSDPKFVAQMAVGTGMQPRSIVNGHDWAFFQAYSWLSYDGRSYLQSDYWKLLVPPAAGASIFMLIGLYMMKSGTKKRK